MMVRVFWVSPGHSSTLCASGSHRPTIMISLFSALGRIRRQMSIVKIVLPLLKMDVSELMRAAIITATIKPRTPENENVQS